MATLPEYLTEQTENALLQRMLDRVPSDVDKTEGSYIWDALSPAALELFAAAGWAQETLRRGFASTTFGAYLDLRCGEHGLTRRPAVKARSQVEFAGTAGATIPAGTVVSTLADPASGISSIAFATLESAVLSGGGKAIVDVEAVEAGASGNVSAGAIQLLEQAVAGVSGAVNLTETSGGLDTEADAALLERYYAKVRRPGTSGNKADYEQWALEIPGVGGVQVEPLWDGPGTVRVFVLGADKQAPEMALVQAVQQSIAPALGLGEGKAPIGAAVTVAGAAEVTVNVGVQLVLAPGAALNDVKAAIEQEITGYLRQLAFTDPVVRYSRISAILSDISGIVDYSGLSVNGGTVNVAVQTGQVAMLGTVTVSV